MRWASAVSRSPAPASEAAALDALERARAELEGDRVDLALLFLSPHHLGVAPAVLGALARRLPGAVLIGCAAHSCIGGGLEVEEGPSLSLTLAHLPGASAHAFAIPPQSFARAQTDAASVRQLTGVPDTARPSFILLTDPFSGISEPLVRSLDRSYPGAVQLGGIASGTQQPAAPDLFIGERMLTAGCVGVALAGDVRVETVVAQGCRPIGQPLFVTRGERNVILELDGRPPLEVLDELAAGATERERILFRTSLFIGLQMHPARPELGRGDFLVRNIVGGDRESGALAIAAPVERNQVVQFQLRDGQTAAEDLELRLSQRSANRSAPRGALLFSCLGRGRGMYGVANHDSDALQHIVGKIPVGGFFCNGEIGPVEGTTFLHAYTSAVGLFRPA